MCPPLGPISSFSCNYWENLAEQQVGTLPSGLAPLLGNPGSTTEFWSPIKWILRARDRDRDILARLRFGHQQPLNRRCPARLGHQRPVNHGCPRVSKPVSQDIQSICYCLHTGIFHLDTCDLVVAGVRISISPKYLYLYLALKLLTQLNCSHPVIVKYYIV